jgi:hypothetical protein
LLAPFVIAKSDGLDKGIDEKKNNRMFIDMPHSLNMRSEEENKNFVLAYYEKKLEGSDEFSSHYKKETELYDWVVIYENDSEFEHIIKIVADNLISFPKIIRDTNIAPKDAITVSTFGSDGKGFNMMVSDLCDFKFKISVLDDLNEITVSTMHNYPNLDFCNAYPVILGASGILVEPDGKGGVILKRRNWE